MTLSPFLPYALFFALGCAPIFGAAHDTGNPIPEVTRPHGDRVDRAWKRYRNHDLDYCVSYPSRWLKGDAFDGSGLFVETGLQRYSKPTGEIDIGRVAIVAPEDARLKPAALTNDDLEQDVQEHFAGLQKFARAERLQVLEQHPLKLQGFTGLYVKSKYYDPLERSNWMEEVVFFQRKGDLYRLELQCQPDQIKRFESVFSYLVNTFQFDCGK